MHLQLAVPWHVLSFCRHLEPAAPFPDIPRTIDPPQPMITVRCSNMCIYIYISRVKSPNSWVKWPNNTIAAAPWKRPLEQQGINVPPLFKAMSIWFQTAPDSFEGFEPRIKAILFHCRSCDQFAVHMVMVVTTETLAQRLEPCQLLCWWKQPRHSSLYLQRSWIAPYKCAHLYCMFCLSFTRSYFGSLVGQARFSPIWPCFC